MKAAPRLYVDEPLAQDQELHLSRDVSHYVMNVMRRRVGDELRLFNGRDGEWLAHLIQIERKAVQVRVIAQTRSFADVPDLRLLFAPVKKARTEFIVEKATELGARSLQTVLTARTTAQPLREARMGLIIKEAAEQTERLDLPVLFPTLPLQEALSQWDEERLLIFCDETSANSEVSPMLDSLRGSDHAMRKAAILIGPQGGFAPEEREMLCDHAFVLPVTLGPRILRSDTAALAAMTLWQSVCGDWRG